MEIRFSLATAPNRQIFLHSYAELEGVLARMNLENAWFDRKIHSSDYETFIVRFRLLGGKGGFGSNLRAQGNKMSSKKRAGNYEACRDLAGRRIRTVSQAQSIAEYLQAAPKLQKEKEEAIRVKMEKILETEDKKKHTFKDVEYIKKCNEIVDNVEMMVLNAMVSKNQSQNAAKRCRFLEKDILNSDNDE